MAEPPESLRLAELLCARISHDLSGMIGTLAGALELADDPALRAEVVALARQAATELRQRLELHRASWGPATGPIGLPMLRSLAEGLPQARRCSLDLSGLPPDLEFPPLFGRVVLNLLLLAAESLNGNGVVTLAGDSTDLLVAIAGPRAAWPNGLAACLAGQPAAYTAVTGPRSLQLPLTVLMARAAALRLSLLVPAGAPSPAPPLRLQQT